MYPRTNYEMTEADLKTLLEAMQPVSAIMLQCGSVSSVQERANAAWAVLGKKMGFDPMTVQPAGRDPRFFTAIPAVVELPSVELPKAQAMTIVGLELTKGFDGYWLSFKTKSGNASSIHIDNNFNGKGIGDSAVRQWAREQEPINN